MLLLRRLLVTMRDMIRSHQLFESKLDESSEVEISKLVREFAFKPCSLSQVSAICHQTSREQEMPQSVPSKANLLLFQERRARQDAWKVCFQETLSMPLWTIPRRIAGIFASGQTASNNECEAAERCCCHRCAALLVNNAKMVESLMCASCGRSGCQSCITLRADGRNVCSSRVCALVSRLNSGLLNLDQFCIESDKLSRMLMQQWLVLQFKQERQLGCLRAYFLVQSRYSALLCGQALSLRNSFQSQLSKVDSANDENTRDPIDAAF